jgi:alkanesulfonate monooxygenase SsuD/methylene tetrahydromethanopterin reductase-like flavin-dependent oxidoreductase (luciferase family)
VKKIGFLSFGHWGPGPQSLTRSGADALQQSIELAVAAEQVGADGAYFRVHHFARQLGVEYNAHVIESILTHVAPPLGWR